MKQSLRHITLVLTGILALTTTLAAASERTSSPMTGLNSRDALPSIQDTASDWSDTLALNHEEAHQDLDLQTTSSTTTTIIAEGSRRLLMDETAQPKDKKRKARKNGQTPNRKDSTGHTDTTDTLKHAAGTALLDRSATVDSRSSSTSQPAVDSTELRPMESMPEMEAPMMTVPGVDQMPTQLQLGQDSIHALTPPVGEKRHFLPTRRRMDREINRIPYIFKNEVAVGLTVSYGAINSDDTDYMLIFDNLNFKGSLFTITPSFIFFLKNNLGIGARFGYSKAKGDIGNATLNLGSANDMNIDLSDIHLDNQSASFGLFMRSYAAIDNKGHFGVFAELEASYKAGKSTFSYKSNDQMKYTHSNTQQFKFSFNPGCSVFIFPNVCSTISFGLGGLQYTKVTQSDDKGKVIGSRETAKMLFRLNLANIRIGVNFFL